MAWALVSIRHLREHRLPAVALASIVLVTAFLASLAPRLLDRVADTAIRAEVAGAHAFVRNVQLIEERRIGAEVAAPLRLVDAAGDELAGRMPAAVRALVDTRTAIIDTPRFSIVSTTREPSTTVLRVQQGAEGRVRFVEGRPPTGAIRREVLAVPGETPGEAPATRWTVLEGSLSVASGAGFGLAPNDVALLVIDPTDPLGARHDDRLAIEITGLYEIADPDDPYWFEERSLARPLRRAVSQDEVYLHAPILLAEAAYPALVGSTEASELPMRHTWRFFVDPGRLDGERLEAVHAALRGLEGVFTSTIGVGGNLVGTRLRSGLVGLVEDFLGRWHAAEAILLVVAVGPTSVAGAALGLVAALAAARRRAAVTLWSDRGASRIQVLGALALEAMVVVAPAAGLGLLAAWALVPSAPAVPAIAAGSAVAVAGVLLIVALGRAPTSPARGAAPAGRRIGSRRLVLEALVVGLAILGAVLLRQRGVAGAGAASAGSEPAADPFIAAVPALVGLAAGVVLMRLFPIPVGGLARVAAWGRGLVPVLALRRAVHAGIAARVLLVLMATASIGTFASAALLQLDVVAERAGWQQVGAPYLLTDLDGTLPSQLDPATLPEVDAAAGAHHPNSGLAARGLRVSVLAVDSPEYREVVRGTVGDPDLPAELLAPAAGGAPPPAIVSSRLAEGRDAVGLGSTIELVVDGRTTSVRVVAIRDSFPALAVDAPFVVVSREHLREAIRGARLATTHAFLRAPEEAAATIRAALAEDWPAVVLESRADRTSAIRTSPITEAVRTGASVAVAVAAAYAALAVAAALALAGAARAAEAAQLRTIGLTRRQSAALVVVEHAPGLAVAFAAGVVLGFGLFVVLRPGLGLGGLVGTTLEVPLVVDPAVVTAVFATIAAIGAIGIAIGAILQARADPAAVARRGLE